MLEREEVVEGNWDTSELSLKKDFKGYLLGIGAIFAVGTIVTIVRALLGWFWSSFGFGVPFVRTIAGIRRVGDWCRCRSWSRRRIILVGAIRAILAVGSIITIIDWRCFSVGVRNGNCHDGGERGESHNGYDIFGEVHDGKRTE